MDHASIIEMKGFCVRKEIRMVLLLDEVSSKIGFGQIAIRCLWPNLDFNTIVAGPANIPFRREL